MRHSFRAFPIAGLIIVAFAILCACGGSSDTASLPGLFATGTSGSGPTLSAAAATANVLAINAGGGATGAFVADRDYNVAGTSTYTVAHAIDTGAVTNPAPQAAYQSERYGSTLAYTIPGLTAGAAYTVRLDFAELYWTAPRQRVFNVSINNAHVLTNFDVVASAGAPFKAIAESFTATATSSGTITIVMSAITNYAAINAIEIAPLANPGPSPSPSPSMPPAGSIAIDSGGGAFGTFVADQDYVAVGTQTYSVSHAIDTSAVTNPAPQAVYQSERYGSNLSYTIRGLTPGAAYTVRLGFAELYWTAPRQRIFNASINNVIVLSNFDIFATTGATDKAIVEAFTATATPSGTITIAMTASINYAALNALEVVPAGGAPSSPAPNTNVTIVVK